MDCLRCAANGEEMSFVSSDEGFFKMADDDAVHFGGVIGVEKGLDKAPSKHRVACLKCTVSFCAAMIANFDD
ncbi:hypothetical protein TNCT_652231 [Trichonephila clavata]|uniref:Uncharacterized protein n=1 Tax=Trichonephila clavata TaxID=2740835 RepID=A0A8X6K7R7_TRICU|nr:hypothetical protein TNCT_652231 [Trichonephila clavata]